MTLIASIDVGKTHTRLALIDPHSGAEVRSVSRDNQRVETPLGRQLDIAGIESWLIDALRNEPERHQIAAIVPIAHGAAAALIGANGEILAAPDYEDARFDEVRIEYERERDPFEQTYSPGLPRGLNLGRQFFYLQHQRPELFTKVKHILTFPQFWAWRLSGVMASEVTSLGCHSDLWLPAFSKFAQTAKPFSALARKHAWHKLFPPRRFAGESLGHARGPLAAAAELPRSCRIMCGIHDSNASYLRYLLDRRDTPFAVISSGTWTVLMANRAPLDTLRAHRDMLANVDAFGSAVATARFMGGREYEAIATGTGLAILPSAQTGEAQPNMEAVKKVISDGAMAFPSFALGGPFPNAKGRTINAAGMNLSERAALATMYVALMCDLLLESLKTQGHIIIDGPLASNPVFPSILASLRPRSTILIDGVVPVKAGTQSKHDPAIYFLAGFPSTGLGLLPIAPINLPALNTYRTHWRAQLH